ncbi:hypothetical protein [Leifsonia sp. AG29]|uniref:hypothetical protein n=1 Tax=Leifsonia sp. AG29 TaxID=2598860 RepID=UPI00131B7B50|nr:hypothetical protein [Leifsonia sp. AG29]
MALTGCAGGEDYSAKTASTLQHGVLDVATAAQGSDFTAALAKLDALESANESAFKNGAISSARHAAVARSIASIRAELTRLQADAEKAQLQQQLQELQQLQQQQQQQQQQKPAPKDKSDSKKGGKDG